MELQHRYYVTCTTCTLGSQARSFCLFQSRRLSAPADPVPLQEALPKTRQHPSQSGLHTQSRAGDAAKNQDMFIRPLPAFMDPIRTTTLPVYGEGRLSVPLRDLVRSLGLQEHVFLPGSTPDTAEKIMVFTQKLLTWDFAPGLSLP